MKGLAYIPNLHKKIDPLRNIVVKSKSSTLLATLEIDRSASAPIYRQLEDFLRRMILNGALYPKQKLPSTRALAHELGVSRITVKSVYEQLISEGYAQAKTGAGTFISAGLKTKNPTVQNISKPRLGSPIKGLSDLAEKINLSKSTTRYGSIMPLHPGVPALDKFPAKRWSKYISRAMVQEDRSHLSDGFLYGSENLRSSIACHLENSRGMLVDPEQIIITSGAQQALFLIALVLLTSEDTVWFENPGHIAGRDVVRLIGAKIAPVPIESEGLDIHFAAKNYLRPTLIFATPSHQQPLGVTMSLRRRLELLKYAHENEAWIIEHDYDSEFRYRGRPLPALSGLDKAGRVLYVGTFSKSLCSAVRLGYVVLPHWLVDTFAKARNLLGQSSSPITEEALSKFMNDGRFAEHIRKMRRIYRGRRDTLLNCLQEYCADTLIPQQSDAGMHLIADLKNGLDDQVAHKVLLDSGIDSLPLSVYCSEPIKRSALVLGFSGVPKKTIIKVTRKLGKTLRSI